MVVNSIGLYLSFRRISLSNQRIGGDKVKDIKTEIHEPCLLQSGFYPDSNNGQYIPEGTCFSVLPEKGQGHFWTYYHENLFSIMIQDFVFYEDLFLEYQQPRYINVNCYDSVSGEEIRPYRRLPCNCINGHIGNNNLYQAIFHKNIPIRSTGIMIMPEYYEDYLRTKFPGEYKDPRSAFISVDGRTDFPELIFLLRQLRNFRGTGISAKLYYEGKVAEAVSLIIEKTSQSKSQVKNICGEDLESLAYIVAYINDYFTFDLSLNQLARMACMGTTKLKYTFKEVYKCTITEYIQNKKMAHAEHLLANTDMSIKQIAQLVSYKDASRFSELFCKSTGLLPNEYRKLSMSK